MKIHYLLISLSPPISLVSASALAAKPRPMHCDTHKAVSAHDCAKHPSEKTRPEPGIMRRILLPKPMPVMPRTAIEKVESVAWYLVKIGPYSQMGSVNNVMSRLQNGMKPMNTGVDR